MQAIPIAKLPLQDAERRQRARLLTTTTMHLLLAPTIFQTARLVGWKGPRFATAADTLNFCNFDTQHDLGVIQPLALRFPPIGSAFLRPLTRFHFCFLHHASNKQPTQIAQAKDAKLPYRLLNSQKHPKEQNFSTPHSFAQNSNDGLFVLVAIQLPLIIENQTHKTTNKNVSSSVTISLNSAPALLFSRSLHPSLRLVWLGSCIITSSPFCLLQALAFTTLYCSSSRHHCWFARRLAVSSICCCVHQPPPSDELRLSQGIDSLSAPKPVDANCAMLKVPTAGTNSWKRSHKRETATLMGPMSTPKRILHYISKTAISILVTISGIQSHSETSN